MNVTKGRTEATLVGPAVGNRERRYPTVISPTPPNKLGRLCRKSRDQIKTTEIQVRGFNLRSMTPPRQFLSIQKLARRRRRQVLSGVTLARASSRQCLHRRYRCEVVLRSSKNVWERYNLPEQFLRKAHQKYRAKV